MYRTWMWRGKSNTRSIISNSPDPSHCLPTFYLAGKQWAQEFEFFKALQVILMTKKYLNHCTQLPLCIDYQHIKFIMWTRLKFHETTCNYNHPLILMCRFHPLQNVNRYWIFIMHTFWESEETNTTGKRHFSDYQKIQVLKLGHLER